MKTSNTSQLSKFAMGDTVMRKGELCTVVKVDYSMDPVSYTVRVNSNGRIVGTEERYLSPVETSVDGDEEEDSFLADVHTFQAATEPNCEEHVSSDDEDSDSDSFMRGVTRIMPAMPHYVDSDSGSPSEEMYEEPKPQVRRQQPRHQAHPRYYSHTAPAYGQRRAAPVNEPRCPEGQCQQQRYRRAAARPQQLHRQQQKVYRQQQNPFNAFFQSERRFFPF